MAFSNQISPAARPCNESCSGNARAQATRVIRIFSTIFHNTEIHLLMYLPIYLWIAFLYLPRHAIISRYLGRHIYLLKRFVKTFQDKRGRGVSKPTNFQAQEEQQSRGTTNKRKTLNILAQPYNATSVMQRPTPAPHVGSVGHTPQFLRSRVRRRPASRHLPSSADANDGTLSLALTNVIRGKSGINKNISSVNARRRYNDFGAEMSPILYAAVGLLLAAGGGTENSTSSGEDACELRDAAGPWSAALEDWALSAPAHGRHGRIMALPPAQGYYVSDRMDGALLPPPPPPPRHHPPPPPAPSGRPYAEWQPTPPPPPPPGAGKIVNRPPNPYKDKFKPSYPAPSPNQPIPVYGPRPPGYQNSVDRVDESRPAPQKQVSETDLYLLGAIEKLVYRVDFMEKRLRKMEENMHYLVAGVEAKPEPCATNFTRVGGGCYHMSSDAANWKGASYACRRLKANLLEIDDGDERRRLSAAVLRDDRLKGGDFWTGGLNPGLLWIWSHSARPVVGNSSAAGDDQHSATVVGEGRCLAWVHDAATAGLVYRGQDCSLRHRYICEKEEDKTKLSNEIERAARGLRGAEGAEGAARRPKVVWSDDGL